MKMTVVFEELNEELKAEFGESEQQFDADIEEFNVLHDGQNGATFFPVVSEDGIISWTNDRELDNPAPVNIKGANGVGVARVYLKTIGMGDGATSTYVVELTDSSIGGTISVKNGSKGSAGYTPVKGVDYFDGAPGKPGTDGRTPVKGVDYFDGAPGKPGKDGYTPIKGVDYFDGAPGAPGQPGQPGQPGADGYTPVKGKDYFTDAEKAEMVAAVRAQLIVEQWTFTLSDGTTVTKDVVVE